MSVAVGDIVELTVTKVAGYAFWGETRDGETGFVHCIEWSWEKPIPDQAQPKVNDRLLVMVFRVVAQAQKDLPADVTFDGTISVDFAASVRLLRQKPNNGDVFHSQG